MTVHRHRGFTLIELLVVIAIIAILAAMLFPVFARARESARKIQCLANVKNVATAVQMYLTDYDRFPPRPNHDQDLLDYFWNAPGGRTSRAGRDCCNRACQANPWGRWPVVLDEYTRNRDVWRCPSALVAVGPAFIVPSYTPVWWHYLRENEGDWGTGTAAGGPCMIAYPPGWGGSVTDSIGQQQQAGLGDAGSDATGAVELTIGFTNQHMEMKTSQMDDASWFVVCADSSRFAGSINSAESVMYSLCGASWPSWGDGCPSADWSNCSFTQNCGLDPNALELWNGDASYRSKYTRHLGGANVGFADGHASWWHAEAFFANSPWCECCSDETGYSNFTLHTEGLKLTGLCPVP